MKKVFTILLFLVYSIATFGIGLKGHYCCGKLKSVTVAIIFTENHKCSKSDENNGCCQSKVQLTKINDDQITVAEVQVPAKPSLELHTIPTICQLSFYNTSGVTIAYSYHAPPHHINIPIYIYNCVYRI
jgi:hypothetical protein